MNRLSPIHPNRYLKPGRYMLDELGVLWTPLVDLPLRMVAAVVVLAPGELTRRQRAEQAAPTPTDDLRSPEEDAINQAITDAIQDGAIGYDRRAAHNIVQASKVPRPIDKPTRSLARREKPTAVKGFQALIDGDARTDEDDAAVREFDTKLKAARARRAKLAATKPAPAIDGKRVAAAFRAKPTRQATAVKVPTRRALADTECHRCGVRTTIGCEHFLPFQPEGHNR